MPNFCKELPDSEARLLSPEDLVSVTGAKRYSKQAAWFKHEFGADVPQRVNGSLVMTWETFAALERRKYGLAPTSAARPRVDLCYD
ncbi:MAG TPA: DUF4224 domain-containing protein [Trinickia sp.]|uniref:DUF4224 domain-containing protein n=1 Tax=Trinickia sp. TaxID=2571163 RepID=UPI002BF59DBB|nr:DUF4224 domain-containing protein [Trinickia sp.]HVW53016.1 DUF4224 domain-containing protein [Trinickia sp.]